MMPRLMTTAVRHARGTDSTVDLSVRKDAQPGFPRVGCEKSARRVFSPVTRRTKALVDRGDVLVGRQDELPLEQLRLVRCRLRARRPHVRA